MQRKRNIELENINIIEKRKAQLANKWHPKENIKKIQSAKKPFPKLGIFIIIFVIIGLIAVEYGPWSMLQVTKKDGSMIEKNTYKNFRGTEDEPWNIRFNKPWSDFSSILKRDFYQAPAQATIGLVSLLMFGILLVLLSCIDKKRNISIGNFNISQSILYLSLLIPIIFLIQSQIRFVGSYIVRGNNYEFQEEIMSITQEIDSIQIVSYPVSYFLIISLSIILIAALTLFEANVTRLIKDIKQKQSRNYSFEFNKSHRKLMPAGENK